MCARAHGPRVTTIAREAVDVDLAAQMRNLVERVEALVARVDALERLAPRSIDDRVWLPAIVRAASGRAFSAKELIAHGRVDRDLAAALDGLSVKQIGQRLRALAGTVIVDGFTIARIGRDGDGCIWSVVSHVAHGDRARAGV